MKATFRIVIPAAATAAAALLLTACADKPVRIPGGAFVEEPYQGETETRPQTIPSNSSEPMETEGIYIEDEVPVGPVEEKGPKGDSTSAQQGGPQVQPVEQIEPETKSNAPEGSVEYRVVKGDTLWNIGMVYGVSVNRLAEVNGIDKNATLKVGQVIMIPPDAKNAVGKPIPEKKSETKSTASNATSSAAASTKTKPTAKDGETLYVVKRGDTLSEIALRHHVKTADLAAANKIKVDGILRIGQTLVIPASGKAAASSTKTATSTATATKTDSSNSKPASAATSTKSSTSTKTDSSATTKPASADSSSGGIVGPIGGTSAKPASTPAATSGSASAAGSKTVMDINTISIPTEFDATIEELAIIHERNLEDLLRLNPSIKPGQRISVGTIIKMPVNSNN